MLLLAHATTCTPPSTSTINTFTFTAILQVQWQTWASQLPIGFLPLFAIKPLGTSGTVSYRLNAFPVAQPTLPKH